MHQGLGYPRSVTCDVLVFRVYIAYPASVSRVLHRKPRSRVVPLRERLLMMRKTTEFQDQAKEYSRQNKEMVGIPQNLPQLDNLVPSGQDFPDDQDDSQLHRQISYLGSIV